MSRHSLHLDGVLRRGNQADSSSVSPEQEQMLKEHMTHSLVPLKLVLTLGYATVIIMACACCIAVTMSFFSESTAERTVEHAAAVATRTSLAIATKLSVGYFKTDSWLTAWINYMAPTLAGKEGTYYGLTNYDASFWAEALLDSFVWGRNRGFDFTTLGLCLCAGEVAHADYIPSEGLVFKVSSREKYLKPTFYIISKKLATVMKTTTYTYDPDTLEKTRSTQYEDLTGGCQTKPFFKTFSEAKAREYHDYDLQKGAAGMSTTDPDVDGEMQQNVQFLESDLYGGGDSNITSNVTSASIMDPFVMTTEAPPVAAELHTDTYMNISADSVGGSITFTTGIFQLREDTYNNTKVHVDTLVVSYLRMGLHIFPTIVDEVVSTSGGATVVTVVYRGTTPHTILASSRRFVATASDLKDLGECSSRVPVPLPDVDIEVCVHIVEDGRREMDSALEETLLVSAGVFMACIILCAAATHVLFLPLRGVEQNLARIAQFSFSESDTKISIFSEFATLQIACNKLAADLRELSLFLPDSVTCGRDLQIQSPPGSPKVASPLAPQADKMSLFGLGAGGGGVSGGCTSPRSPMGNGRRSSIDYGVQYRQLIRRNISVVVVSFRRIDVLAAQGQTSAVEAAAAQWLARLASEVHRRSGRIHRTADSTVSVKFNACGRVPDHQRTAADLLASCLQLWEERDDVVFGASSGLASVGCLGGFARLGHVALGRVLEEADVLRHLCQPRFCRALAMREVALHCEASRAVDRVKFGCESSYTTAFEVLPTSPANSTAGRAYLQLWDLLLADEPPRPEDALHLIQHDVDAGVPSIVLLADRIQSHKGPLSQFGTHIAQGVTGERSPLHGLPAAHH
eukprot:TRINITY_DN1185_c0_g1_i3.p1 TRINITY_DN1185_c0_g1~~TRINITY_DN1185_c0_g1_i3.p1  ORF type:complete len:856 (+),score=240.32 TRINITY_DN1185_c0_g1_i3:57-2624(+)